MFYHYYVKVLSHVSRYGNSLVHSDLTHEGRTTRSIIEIATAFDTANRLAVFFLLTRFVGLFRSAEHSRAGSTPQACQYVSACPLFDVDRYALWQEGICHQHKTNYQAMETKSSRGSRAAGSS